MHPKSEPKFDVSLLAKRSEAVLRTGSDSERTSLIERREVDIAPVQKFTRSSGMRILYHERPRSKVFSVYATAMGGTRLELGDPITTAESDWGASHLIGQTWTKGTSTKKSQDIARLTEGRAADLEAFSGRNSVGLELTGLAKDWRGLSDLFTEVLFDPSFSEDEIEHSRRVTLDAMKAVDENSSQLCSKFFLETLFENHPYGKWSYGTEASLAAQRHHAQR
jgi:zinc protease